MSRISGRISTQSKDQNNLLVLLEEAQSKFGCLSQEIMSELAKSVGVSISEVYGAATFYAFLSTKPQGRNVIRICKSLPCFLKNSELIIESVGREIGIQPGETTPDGKFTFQLTNCIGACDKAPAMMINNEVYGDLTSKKIMAILKACK
ncbi:MAG: NAD(P)H-dependent oxidoreductase subunit E [Dehalococcoidales bacterium]|nr:MAG: NAD(P)H-dependent oxidoreductase subunit E [Dehalococcoidales bacterium]